jgi:hypothetical protein
MTTIARTMTIRCPEWCSTGERMPHDPWFVDGTLHVDHQGPEWGRYLYATGAQVDEVVRAEVVVNDLDTKVMSAVASSPRTP